MKIAAIRPRVSAGNAFAELFSRSLEENGFATREFSWSGLLLPRQSHVILHWPDYFFQEASADTLLRLQALKIARAIHGAKIVWVAHNISPHDNATESREMARRFLRAVDGIVHLSAHSPDLLREAFGIAPRREIVVPHGNYAPSMRLPVAAESRDFELLRLFSFGQIRRYKNLESLISCARAVRSQDLRLTISGRRMDEAVSAGLEALASGDPSIVLDLRPLALPQEELEAGVDESHAVVLPYAAINNSGAAIFALSRHRPVLAPRLGALPELLAEVGADWLRLYDGPLTSEILEDFANWLTARRPGAPPDLSARSWETIGRRLADFLASL
ncbi:hypothetical protein H2509_02030 [Stappia sp. F7233]|uniref:Glycosyltransferase n=1 Tax=Stappia albiluteola TaxID=2758565 RepID=A0A839A8L3_9HYPH|nr:hypothetical protein [Stappia albiluteola]MBA5775900.1 hypothetical protein [Stappia albiluteola]